MDRAATKLIEWKSSYDALQSALAALKHAVESGASEDEVRSIRERIERLRSETERVLDAVNEELAARRRTTAQH